MQASAPVGGEVFGDGLRGQELDVGVVLDVDQALQVDGVARRELVGWQGRHGREQRIRVLQTSRCA